MSTPVRLGISGGGGSYLESVTPDGRFVVFTSTANNLVKNDDRLSYLDVFIREIATGETRLVSASHTGKGGANRDASQSVVDASGRWVAFVSAANNLTQDKSDSQFTDVFLRDLQRGETRLISRSPMTGRSGNGDSGGVRLSKNGRWFVFESEASDLVERDVNGRKDVFAWDTQSESLSLVSVVQGGDTSGNGVSGEASLSGDGTVIAFTSSATDLVSGATTGLREIYVRDMVARRTDWVSASKEWCDPKQAGVTRACREPLVSEDGRYVVYRGGEVHSALVEGSGVALCR